MQGGTVVNADRQFAADVLISGGLIQAVGADLEACPCQDYVHTDFTNLWLCTCFTLLSRTPCCCLDS